ncbi:MAG: PaaI family thioesterase, partial [Nannocystaceae bacterium]
EPATHLRIDPSLCGAPIELGPGRAVVRLEAAPAMAADEHGLVHGGFLFGLADYAAMLAVNHPNVVLGGAEVRFLRPVVVGEVAIAEALHTGDEGKKKLVRVEVRVGDAIVCRGDFTCFIPEAHVLAKRGE